jgi:hypothetical protein
MTFFSYIWAGLCLVTRFIWSKVSFIVQFRITHWSLAHRGWKEDEVEIFAHLEEDIWYWLVAEFFATKTMYVCDWLSNIQLPKWLRNWERKWGYRPSDQVCKFEDYWGYDVGTFLHIYVESPICQYVWRHKNNYVAEFTMTIDEARKKFEHFPEHFDWIEKSIEEDRKRNEKAEKNLA